MPYETKKCKSSLNFVVLPEGRSRCKLQTPSMYISKFALMMFLVILGKYLGTFP